MTDQNFTIVRNRTAKFDIAATLSGVAWQLTGRTLKFALKLHAGDTDAAALAVKTIGSGITVTDAPNGLARVQINPADTTALTVGVQTKVYWDLVGIDGTDWWELARGVMFVQSDVVHTLP